MTLFNYHKYNAWQIKAIRFPDPNTDLFYPKGNLSQKIDDLLVKQQAHQIILKELFRDMRNHRINLTSMCPEITEGEPRITLEERLIRFEEILTLFIEKQLVTEKHLLMPLFTHRDILYFERWNTKSLLDKGIQLLTPTEIEEEFAMWNIFNKSQAEKQNFISLQLFYELERKLPIKTASHKNTKI